MGKAVKEFKLAMVTRAGAGAEDALPVVDASVCECRLFSDDSHLPPCRTFWLRELVLFLGASRCRALGAISASGFVQLEEHWQSYPENVKWWTRFFASLNLLCWARGDPVGTRLDQGIITSTLVLAFLGGWPGLGVRPILIQRPMEKAARRQLSQSTTCNFQQP
ncbi:hypothetical protein B0H16DRAFT_1458403 [Mycena metata]|uniref:Uncharacterized protein n=1 Tax=Mycena metata TaxID=1033252 RepID=A0AAD7ND58_9AGAR|nr:hypothetical protein B0H16DRAFT_1458403 [Mycena metata]